jgi:hypothetical protein
MRRFLGLTISILLVVGIAYLTIVWLLFGSQLKEEFNNVRRQRAEELHPHPKAGERAVRIGDYQYSVNAIKRFRSPVHDAPLEISNEGNLVGINITVTNESKNPETSQFRIEFGYHIRLQLNDDSFLERNTDVEKRLPATAAFPEIPGTQEFPAFHQQLSPGAPLTIVVVFDVPPQTRNANLVVADLAKSFRTAYIPLSLPD